MTAVCFVVPAAADDGETCVRGSGDTAIEACTRLLKSGRFDKRNLALIYSNRANQWERKGDFDKAMQDHSEAIRTDATYAAGYMHRGNAYARRGDYERAIADHSEAIRIDPAYANGFYNRGLTYSRKGDHERAIADFTKGIELNANSSQLWGQRCWSRAVIGKQLQEAVDDCTKAGSLAPKIPQIFAYRGFVYLKLGQIRQGAGRLRCGVRADEKFRSRRLALCPRRDQIEKGRHRGRQRGHRGRKGDEGRHRGGIREVRDKVGAPVSPDQPTENVSSLNLPPIFQFWG
jgi:tetratricopeptide (TPR) repeat protein